MAPPVISRVPLAVSCCIGLLLAACGRQPADDMGWARTALERNPRLEIVATDAQARTFTVRIRDTGELRVVRADQLVGGPAADASVAAAAGAASGAAPSTAGASPAAQTEPASTMSPATAAGSGSQGTAAAGEAAATPAAEPPAAPASAATPVFASKALHPGSPAAPVPGQVLEAGPGYTIQAGSSAAANVREPGPAGAVELRHDPIVCQGARLLHIDNQNLQFDGDGLSAEDGCEIHITNSRIRATGVGVSARAANVHIDNSLIEGDTASIDASDGAQIYTASSKFRGLSRRLDTASVHDLGGNVWN